MVQEHLNSQQQPKLQQMSRQFCWIELQRNTKKNMLERDKLANQNDSYYGSTFYPTKYVAISECTLSDLSPMSLYDILLTSVNPNGNSETVQLQFSTSILGSSLSLVSGASVNLEGRSKLQLGGP